MAESRKANELILGKEQGFMLEQLVLLALSSIIAMIALAVVGWEAATGRAFSLDGICLSLICLTLATVFGGSVAWSFHTGEFHRLVRHLRKGTSEKEASGNDRPAAA
jgi:hypothetical protein